jgi:hypothetical protein
MTPTIATAPDAKVAEPQVGTRPIAALSLLAAPELAEPLATSLEVWLGDAPDVPTAEAAELETELALAHEPELALADCSEAENEVVVLLPPVPGRPSNDTSSARSPHRSSLAVSGQHHSSGRGEITYLRRKA